MAPQLTMEHRRLLEARENKVALAQVGSVS